MPSVGDRVEVTTKQAGPRAGVVVAVSGTMVKVKWDAGGETMMVPGPGVLSVVGAAKVPDKAKPKAKGTTKAATKGKGKAKRK
jgi:hypothetical protein